MQIKKLYFKDKKFIESIGKEIEGADAILEVNDQAKEAILTFTRGASIVGKSMAQRQAENLSRSGFILKSGERIAKGCRIIVRQSGNQEERTFQPGNANRL